MRKTILPLCLSLFLTLNANACLSQIQESNGTPLAPSTGWDEPQPVAPAPHPAIVSTAPTVAATDQEKRQGSTTQPLYKKAWKSCKGCATKTARRAKEIGAHPIVAMKAAPGGTVKLAKTCHAKALDFSDNHERDFKAIANLTTLAGAYFFVKNSFTNYGKTTNKTVILGQ